MLQPAALHVCNLNFHERTNHIKVDYHFIREKLECEDITTRFVNSSGQLANIFTMSLKGPRIKHICNKLGTYNLCVLTWGECFGYPISTSLALNLIFAFNNKIFMRAIASSSLFYFQMFVILRELNIYALLGAVLFSLLFCQICSSYRLFKRKEKKSLQRYWKIDSTNISKETKRSFLIMQKLR